MDSKQRRAVPAKNGRAARPSDNWPVRRLSAKPNSPAREPGSAAGDDGVAENASVEPVLAAFSRAVKVQQGGREDEAIVLYRRILFRHPNLPEVHCNLGA